MLNILSGIFLVIGLTVAAFGICCLMLAGWLKSTGVRSQKPGAREEKKKDAEVLVATKDGEIKKMRVM